MAFCKNSAPIAIDEFLLFDVGNSGRMNISTPLVQHLNGHAVQALAKIDPL